MQLNAITGKSALMAILLLVAILVATAVRYSVAPFEMELADSEFCGRRISLIFAMFLLLCCGIIEGKILPRSGLNKGYCTLPIPLYGALSCGVFVAPGILGAATASLCLAMALYLLLRSLHSAGEKDSVFFAALLLGTMVLVIPPSVVFVAVIPIAIFVLALSLRQALLLVAGYMLPMFGASYVVWYKGGTIFEFWQNLYSSLLSPQMSNVESVPYLSIIIVIAIVVILLWGAIYMMVRPDKMFMLSRVRRALYLFVWVSLLSLTMLLLPACNLSVCAIVAVPVAILLSFVLGILPNNHATIAYWIVLALLGLHLFVK